MRRRIRAVLRRTSQEELDRELLAADGVPQRMLQSVALGTQTPTVPWVLPVANVGEATDEVGERKGSAGGGIKSQAPLWEIRHAMRRAVQHREASISRSGERVAGNGPAQGTARQAG